LSHLLHIPLRRALELVAAITPAHAATLALSTTQRDCRRPSVRVCTVHTSTCPVPASAQNAPSILPVQKNQLTADFKHQHHDYEIKMHTFKTSCDDLQLKLDACEHTVKHHFTMYKQNIQRINTTIINEFIEQMKINITALISDKMLEFEGKFNALVDDMIQDVYVASEEANKTMFANSEYILTCFTNKMTTESDQMLQHLHHPSQAKYDASRQKLDDMHNKVQHFKQSSAMPETHTNSFPNVKLDTTFCRSPNSFESSASLPGCTF
jgi:hypothetical protein